MAAWLMNGTAIRAQGIDLLGPTARTEVGSPRLNADTFPDVLLQDNASASLTTLLLTWSGTTPAITNGSVSGTLSPTQKVVATADLDGDGKADVLFQDTNTGRLSYWLLNNSTVIATGTLPSFGDVSNWKVVGTPDLNRDGRADILLQSASAPPRAKTPFGFVGKAGYYSDEESGLQLLGHRYYLPKLGRFLTQDPTGFEGGLNLYEYVNNNPLGAIDPTGNNTVVTRRANGALRFDTYVVFTGAGATPQKIAAVVQQIQQSWNLGKGQRPYNLDFYVHAFTQVQYDLLSSTFAGGSLQQVDRIELKLGNDNSFTNGTNDPSVHYGVDRRPYWLGRGGSWSIDPTNDWGPFAHEYGHLLGLSDRRTFEELRLDVDSIMGFSSPKEAMRPTKGDETRLLGGVRAHQPGLWNETP